MRRGLVALALLAGACGASPPPRDDRPPTTEQAAPPQPPPFAGHGPLVLRSVPPTASVGTAQPPLYAELAADGSVTGTRCSATRFTDEGSLEREGTPVAHVESDAEGLVVRGEGDAPGWTIRGSVLIAGGAARFELAGGTIAPGDPELPAVGVVPPDADPALALALFATLLVCDDVGP